MIPMFSIELLASISFMSFVRLAYRMPVSAENVPTSRTSNPGPTVVGGIKSMFTRTIP